MKWDETRLSVFLDLSTYCNAGCPQCHRTNPAGLGKVDWLPLIQWDLDMFKKAFPNNELANINEFDICGTWGDPVMCKELYEIIEYIILNSNCNITINTNGSIRDEEWWWNLGVLCGKRLHVVFAVDGCDQEMHEKYRRFTSLEKVLNNMESISYTPARISSQTILFKHNQDYKEEIIDLAKRHGSKDHTLVISDRFDYSHDDTKSYFTDKNNNTEFLEKADNNALSDKAYVSGRKVSKLEKNIVCRWALPRNEVVINPDGQVLPCCYHGNVHYAGRMLKNYAKDFHGHEIYKDYYNLNLEKYNVFHTPLSEIMKSEWYQNILPKSIKGDNPVRQCERQCSSRIKKSHQLRENIIATG